MPEASVRAGDNSPCSIREFPNVNNWPRGLACFPSSHHIRYTINRLFITQTKLFKSALICLLVISWLLGSLYIAFSSSDETASKHDSAALRIWPWPEIDDVPLHMQFQSPPRLIQEERACSPRTSLSGP